MLNPKFLDDLSKKFAEIMPASLKEVKEDFEKQAKAIIHSTFGHLDLVSRQEFDRVIAVLARTRTRVEALEKRLKELESTLGVKKSSSAKKAGPTSKSSTK